MNRNNANIQTRLFGILVATSFVCACGSSTARDSEPQYASEVREVARLRHRASPKLPSCPEFSFEEPSEEFDYTDYADEMLAIIRGHWRIPEAAKLGMKGVVGVRYLINPDGSVACMDFVSRSGRMDLDLAAWDAVAFAQPLSPLPGDLPDTHGEVVNLTFYYNVTPPPKGVVTFEGRVVRKSDDR